MLKVKQNEYSLILGCADGNAISDGPPVTSHI